MMLVHCYLGKSEIEGLGVFTGEHIAAGSVVWRFDPRFDILVSHADLAAAPMATRALFERYGYSVATHPDHLALDGDDGRFMNHSDTPNLDFSVPGLATAVREIEAGEELTCDYDWLADRPYEMQPALHRV
jgi:SET domain-containing protein